MPGLGAYGGEQPSLSLLLSTREARSLSFSVLDLSSSIIL